MADPYHIFLLMGQSNMAGRGVVGEVEALSHPDVYMFRDGQWLPAAEPLHTDKPKMAGIGLGLSFAVDVINTVGLSPIGLVPCAVGGSPLRRWMPGEDLYEAAMEAAKSALAQGQLAGFLWHQGEHDSCDEEMAATYGDRLQTMIGQMRADLDAPDVPFIAGGLGDFLKDFRSTIHFKTVMGHLKNLEDTVPHYSLVSAEGLTDNGDNLHFNAASLHEFGRRYARAFVAITS